MKALATLLALTLAACATPRASEDVRPQRADAPADAGVEALQPAAEPGPATDACAEFDRQQASRLTPEEHQAQFGCPPCPCACIKGEIRCAPCVPCNVHGDPRRPNPLAPKVTGPRQPGADTSGE